MESLLEPTEVSDDLILKQRELSLEKKRLSLAKEFGLMFYAPWKKQDAFHRSTARHRMLRAGNRSGKSTCGSAEDCAWLLGYRPWLAVDDPGRTSGIPQRANKGLVITTDWDKVKEIWTGEQGKIWKYLPRGSVKSALRNHSGAVETIILHNGSILRFDTVESFKKNPQGSESSDWDFVHVDEPCPELMYKAAARGLIDRGGFDWFTLTPLHEFWINDMFFPREGSKRPDTVWSVAASTYENPYLNKVDIAEFESMLTDDEKQCRIHGIPLELSGLVYKQFSYDKHVLKAVPKGWKDYSTPPKNYIIYFQIDPHPQTPHAVLFMAVAPTGQKFIFAELWVSERSIALLSSQILHVLRTYTVGRGEADPIAWIEHPTSERCMADDFMQNGVTVTKSSKDKTYGILHMQEELGRIDNIYFSPNLNRTLFEINRYCYDKENKPIDKDDHMMECMYRMFIDEPIWYDAKTSGTEQVDDIVIDRANFDLPDNDEDPDYI